MDEVLIIGNGFDRKLGLKTDYVSFLDWMKKEGYGVGSNFKERSEKIEYNLGYDTTVSRIQLYKEFSSKSIDFLGKKFNIRNPISGNYFNEPTENKLANDLLYLLPEIIGNTSLIKTKEANIWFSFIQLLCYEKEHRLLKLDISKFEKYLGAEGNWVDIEGLIQKSIEVRVQHDYFKQGIFSIVNYFDIFSLANLLTIDISENHQKTKEKIYELVWNDFLDFKKTLSNYLVMVSNKKDASWSKYDIVSKKYKESESGEKSIIQMTYYHKIINFNYTDFFKENSQVYYVHGNSNDGKEIVFGLDMEIKGGLLHDTERKTTFEINLNKNKQLLRFSKISQLLNLQVDKESSQFNKISILTIVGHSIGEQDYSYYFSILDRNVDHIMIICLWYEYNEGGNNNKESLKDALFEMLTNYEKFSNKRVLHKMIFEGRIKFKEVFIPKLFN